MTDQDITEIAAAVSQSLKPRFEAIDTRFGTIDKRFEGIDKRFDAIDNRFDVADKRFEDINERFDTQDQTIANIDLKFDIYRDEHRQQFKLLHEAIRGVDQKLERHLAQAH